MCCYSDLKVKKSFLAEMKKKNRKTFTAWKVVRSNGRAQYGDYQYHPGTHKVKVDKYCVRNPWGIHVYMNEDWAKTLLGGNKAVPVECNIDDIIRIGYCWKEGSRKGQEQIVLHKISIKKDAWKDAFEE